MALDLPGITFSAQARPVDDFLPRMDIAGFVGFAASGPVNLPLSIEDERQFENVFGGDLPLLWDPDKEQRRFAHLASAVRAFFRAGGQRCWVVRVAEEQTSPQWFPISGMTGVKLSDSSNSPVSPYLCARSLGSWADSVRVKALLERESLGNVDSVLPPETGKEPWKIEISCQSNRPIRPRDLLRLVFRSTDSPSNCDWIIYLPVDSVQYSGTGNKTEVFSGGCVWLRVGNRGDVPSCIRLASRSKPDQTAGRWIPVEESTESPSTDDSGTIKLIYEDDPESALPQKGTVLPARWDKGSNSPKDRYGFILVDQISVNEKAGNKNVELDIHPNNVWELIQPGDLSEETLAGLMVERVTFTLIAEHPKLGRTSMNNLGFAGAHPRSWMNLRDDDDFYTLPDEPDTQKNLDLTIIREARDLNFPLAAPQIADIASEANKEINGADLWFPLGMTESLFEADFTRAAGDNALESALARDGLNADLEDLFLDERLRDTPSSTLEAEAIHHRYVVNGKRKTRLKGIHSLYFVDEITLLAAPDAVQRGWDKNRVFTFTKPAEIRLDEVKNDTARQCFHLSWKSDDVVDGEFLLQHASDPEFLSVIEEFKLKKSAVDIPYKNGCQPHHYFRLRIIGATLSGVWSNTERYALQSGFQSCREIVLGAPQLTLDETDRCLTWEGVAKNAAYEVEQSIDPLFAGTTRSDAGKKLRFEISRDPARTRYYRIRARLGPDHSGTGTREDTDRIVGPWSNTVSLPPSFNSEWQLRSVDAFQEASLLKIHLAMLRMVYARGDLVSVLSVPEHFQSRQLIDYKNKLVARVQATEIKSLSYAALYHPWVVETLESQAATRPPDGVACGFIADRAITRGAWVAPANIVLRNLVGLTQAFSSAETARLFEEQINLLTTDSRGFLAFNAHTLSTDESLRPLNVRRLMILLRRLALREGMETMFDPNDEGTRRSLQRIFERMLTELYVRGAFSGDSLNSAFRVEVGESNNSSRSIDQGRLYIDLKVAPSHPLQFLTVRLIQGEIQSSRVVEL